jgi:copper resistance protein C
VGGATTAMVPLHPGPVSRRLPPMPRLVPYRRPGTLLLAVVLATFAFAGLAVAHAELETPTPADGATVEGTPSVIAGVYSQAMTPDGSSLKLVDADGAELATGGVDPADDTRMSIDPVPELAPGTYTVQSTTVSADDGDIDRRTWSFTVVAATPTPSATPTAAPSATAVASPAATASPTAGPTPTPTAGADSSGTSGGGDTLLPILAAVVILAVLGGVLYSRRDRSSTTPS